MSADTLLTVVLGFAALVVLVEIAVAIILVRHGAGPVLVQFALQCAAGLVLIAAIFGAFAGYGPLAVLSLLGLSLVAHLLGLVHAVRHAKA